MAETYKTTPGELDIEMTHGEPFSMSFTVSKNLAGYEHAAAVKLPDGTEIPMSIEVDPGPTTSVVGITLSDMEVTEIMPGVKRWYYRWVAPITGERTVLHGKAKIVSPV